MTRAQPRWTWWRPKPGSLVLAGSCFLLAGAAAARARTYAESATTCGSILTPNPLEDGLFCEVLYDKRRAVIAVLCLVGLVSLLAAVIRARRSDSSDHPGLPELEDRTSFAIASYGICWGVLAPLMVAALVTPLATPDAYSVADVGLPGAWSIACLLAGVSAVALAAQSMGLTRRMSLAAATVAYLPSAAILDAVGHIVWLVAPLLLGSCLCAAAELQRRASWHGPPEWVSTLTLIANAAMVTVVVDIERIDRPGGEIVVMPYIAAALLTAAIMVTPVLMPGHPRTAVRR